MTRLDDLVDVARLDALVQGRYLTRRPHPIEPLVIYDYTARTNYTRTWTPETRLCRGLVVDRDGVVVARPFPKFFTSAEHEQDPSIGPLPPGAPVQVSEKMDGSLGILYPSRDGLAIATRGAFESAPATWATDYWRAHYDGLQPPPGVTWLFEIIYPANRVVVDYGGFEGLVLLAAIDIATGADVGLPEAWPGPVVRTYPTGASVDDARAVAGGAGREGVVVRFAGPPGQPSLRVKVKNSEYVRLHRLMTTVSPRTIWERRASGIPLTDMTGQVPEAFGAWVNAVVDRLDAQYRTIEAECRDALESVRQHAADRRALADAIERSSLHPAVVFKMLDGRAYDQLIWRTIRPSTTEPFLVDIDA